MLMTSPLSSGATTCSAASTTGCSTYGLPLRRTGEPAEVDTPPSEVPASEELNKAEIDPPPPDTSTAPPEDPSELDALEDIITCRKKKTIGGSGRKREESVKIMTPTHTYL